MNMQGLLVVGICKGVRAGREWEGKIQNWELGVGVVISDGFGGSTETVHLIRVNESQKLAVENAASKNRGKLIAVQVSQGCFSGKGGAQAYLNYVPDSLIVCLDELDPFSGEIPNPTVQSTEQKKPVKAY